MFVVHPRSEITVLIDSLRNIMNLFKINDKFYIQGATNTLSFKIISCEYNFFSESGKINDA